MCVCVCVSILVCPRSTIMSVWTEGQNTAASSRIFKLQENCSVIQTVFPSVWKLSEFFCASYDRGFTGLRDVDLALPAKERRKHRVQLQTWHLSEVDLWGFFSVMSAIERIENIHQRERQRAQGKGGRRRDRRGMWKSGRERKALDREERFQWWDRGRWQCPRFSPVSTFRPCCDPPAPPA